MSAPRFVSNSTVSLKGAAAPRVWTLWHEHGSLSVIFDAAANQSIGFSGTPQEIRVALAKGLAAVDRAVAERVAEGVAAAEEVVADAR